MGERRRKKGPREKDLTSRFLSGGMDEDRVEREERFGDKSKHMQQRKTEKTALMRLAEESGAAGDIDTLPVGEVIQVHSLFSEVILGDTMYLCVVRKTMAKVMETGIVVGDRVRFRVTESRDEHGRPEAVIERVEDRATVVTRADSFKGIEQHPIVANAQQMLIVVSLREPRIKWGLVDRMIVAAQSGKLAPIVCLNKMDLADEGSKAGDDAKLAQEVLSHYRALGIATMQTSVPRSIGLDDVRGALKDRTTVLAGHSGVGKSSLVRAIQPQLDLRVGEVSRYTEKGRHTTTSARRYALDFGGHVIDTPGVKLFGLWGVRADTLIEYFPDVDAGTAPQWRVESFQRIAESLGE